VPLPAAVVAQHQAAVPALFGSGDPAIGPRVRFRRMSAHRVFIPMSKHPPLERANIRRPAPSDFCPAHPGHDHT